MYEMADAQGCINTYLPQHVTRNRILDFQGETWKDKRETERPNKNYARAPGWSNVQYRGGTSSTPKCKVLVKVRDIVHMPRYAGV